MSGLIGSIAMRCDGSAGRVWGSGRQGRWKWPRDSHSLGLNLCSHEVSDANNLRDRDSLFLPRLMLQFIGKPRTVYE